MNKSKNNNSNNVKISKASQWIRDIAAGAKLTKDDKASKNLSNIHLQSLGNLTKQKNKIKLARVGLKKSVSEDINNIVKLKKIHKRLIDTDKNSKGNKAIESQIKKSIERDEDEIMKKINKRFNN